MFRVVHRNFYNTCLSYMHRSFADVRENVVERITNDNTICYLSDDDMSGFAISDHDELVGVFAKGSVRGKDIIRVAKDCGARRLDCFDNGLTDYYAKHGFKIVRREPNWTAGKPDVVYMSR